MLESGNSVVPHNCVLGVFATSAQAEHSIKF
jgi:hypothetical protein